MYQLIFLEQKDTDPYIVSSRRKMYAFWLVFGNRSPSDALLESAKANLLGYVIVIYCIFISTINTYISSEMSQKEGQTYQFASF